MARWLHSLLVGLVGAGIVHIVVLLLVPVVSERGPWDILEETVDMQIFTRLGSLPEDPLARGLDPFFRAAACRYDLEEAPTRIAGEGRVPFWSVSVYDRYGQNVYSLNDRTPEGGRLDIVLLTGGQMIELQKDPPQNLDRSVFVETVPETGIVVLRSFVPDSTWEGVVDRFLDSARCAPL